LLETLLFAWIFGFDQFREEMTRGHQLRIPKIFYPVMRYVVPLLLIAILGAWFYSQFDEVILMKNARPEDRPWLITARASMLILIAGLAIAAMASPSLRKAIEKP
jgi:neurotransmitter:Na+ symporter, NSS family